MNKRQNWSFAEKREVLSFLETHTIKEAMTEFDVPRENIYRWKRMRGEISQVPNPKRKRLAGGGRKLTSLEIETSALHFVNACRQRGQAVTGPLIQLHAESLAKATDVDLKASSGWLSRFKERHELVNRRATISTQKSAAELEVMVRAFFDLLQKTKVENKLQDDVRIWNFDETPLYFDMPMATTLDFKGTRDVVVCKSILSRKRFTAVMMVSSRGEKLRPFLIFPGKRGKIAHDIKQLVCVKQKKGFMDSETMLRWIEMIVAPSRSNIASKEILILDAFSAHADKRILKRLKDLKLIPIFIPGGCTAYLQPLDVAINKPFKDRFRRQYWTWMGDEKIHEFTTKGNMKSAPPAQVAGWVDQAWGAISTELISTSFRAAGSISTPGVNPSEDAEEKFLEKLREP